MRTENAQKNQDQINIPATSMPRVAIIGGGFAGLHLAEKLKNKPFQVVLFDRHNYHTFQPLLYQVATAGLEPDSIAGPLRKFLEKKHNFYFRMARVNEIDPIKNLVVTDIGIMEFDYLVIANGSKTNYFGMDEKFEKAFPLKQVPQALDLRSHLLQNFEKATITADPEEKQQLLNFVVVGGGPTGVELSGALGELKKHVLPHDYPELDLDKMNIYLVEGLPRLLMGMSEKAGEKAMKYLEKFDVNVMLETMVEDYDGVYVKMKSGETLQARTLVWAAGVTGNIISGLKNEDTEKNRILVDRYHRVKGYDNIFAIGDVAAMYTQKFPKGHPMLAPVAIQQGKSLAKNLIRLQKEKPLHPFEYNDKGSMATVGRNRAVVDFPSRYGFGGLLAWFAWMFVHLISLIGFRNKLIVFSNWVWNYFTYDRGNRLIIRPFVPKASPASQPEEPEKEPQEA